MKSYLPVVAIIGRPNVGKSTLFNRLTKTRDALVANFPGLTRDRQYGRGKMGEQAYWVIDTGGIEETDTNPLADLVAQQVQQAIKEADALLWLVDAQTGLTVADQELAQQLRVERHKLTLVVNKSDRLAAHAAAGDFYSLGIGEPVAIAANTGRGVDALMQQVLARIAAQIAEAHVDDLSGEVHRTHSATADDSIDHCLDESDNDALIEGGDSLAHSSPPAEIRVAILGRPNVGKSTLINRILGEERVIVSDVPGTTRDSIEVPFERDGQPYILIDTAGIRRRAKVTETIEKFSILKSLQAIQQADIIVQVFDAQEGITEQDLRLTALILAAGRALIIVFNKWDGLSSQVREQFKAEVDRRLTQVDFARRYSISALHGSGVGQLYHAMQEAYASIYKVMPTGKLTRILQQAIAEHSPPRAGGRHIRPRYAHLGNRQPLSIVIHGKQCERLPLSYQRYLTHYYRKACDLVGVPIQLILKSDDNPYKKAE